MNETPPDLSQALKAAGLAKFFAGCTIPHRHEYLQWIGEAKKPETRAARIAKAVQMLSAKAAQEAAKLREASGVRRL